MKKQFILMSEYNQWMNESLLSNMEEMSESDLYDDRGAFWGSAFHTMSHILTCDLLWLNRFTGIKSTYFLAEALSQFPQPESNSSHYFDTLKDLRSQRATLDSVIIDWIISIPDSEFSEDVTYQNTSGVNFIEPFASVLFHFFNHQTNHRGQVTTLMSQSGDNSYCTDVLALLRR